MKSPITSKQVRLSILLFFSLIICASNSFAQTETCNAGDNFYAAICNPILIDLNDYLSDDADEGGIWETASGASGLIISPEGIVDVSIKNHLTLGFTYIVTSASGSCQDNASISFEIDRVSAGENGELDILQGSTVDETKLFNALQGTPTLYGSWSPTPNGAATYTYTQEAKNGCPIQTATVIVTEFATLTAGDDIGYNMCQDPGEINLDSFLAKNANKGGSWEIKEDDDKPIKLKKPRTLDFGGLGAGNFTFKMSYKVDDSGTAQSTSEVTFNIDVPESAGEDGTLYICKDEPVTNAKLFLALTGNPSDFGSWTQNTANPVEYFYTQGDINDCNNSATVTVVEEIPKSAGLDGTLPITPGSTFTKTNLFDALKGNPVAGGEWTPEIDGIGDYTYTHAATSNCPATSAKVTVSNSTLAVDQTILAKLSLFPNPVKNKLFITGDNLILVQHIEFYSMQGQLLKRVTTNFEEIDLSNFKAALYLVKIKSDLGTGTIKLIKY